MGKISVANKVIEIHIYDYNVDEYIYGEDR